MRTFFVSLFLFSGVFPSVSLADERVCDQSPAQLAEQYRMTVMSIKQDVKDKNGFERSFNGAGVFIDKEGYFLSSMHLAYDGDDEKRDMNVDDGKFDEIDNRDTTVLPYDANTYTYWVRIGNREYSMDLVGVNRYIDAALFKVDLGQMKEKIIPAKLGNSDTLKRGDRVLVIGNPEGYENSLSAGIVTGLHRRHEVGLWYVEDYIQTDALIIGGNSGGVMLNACGEVVGMSAARHGELGFAVPINLVTDSIPRMKKDGRIRAGWLGARVLHENFVRRGTFSQDYTQIHTISGYERNAALERLLEVTETLSAVVTKVEENSPAQKAGIKQGDVVVEFNGTAVKDGYDFRLAMTKTRVGQEVAVKVIRVDKRGRDRPIVFTVKLLDKAAVKESLRAK